MEMSLVCFGWDYMYACFPSHFLTIRLNTGKSIKPLRLRYGTPCKQHASLTVKLAGVTDSIIKYMYSKGQLISVAMLLHFNFGFAQANWSYTL